MVIDEEWAEAGLEYVYECPMCGSNERTLAHKDVQDWSFYCAPGKWNYWDCSNCKSLYLDPRPTRAQIGDAYARYYTHTPSARGSFVRSIKERMRNEWQSKMLAANIEPRFHFPKLLSRLVSMIGRNLEIPFGWKLLTTLPKGKFMDVGCGNGQVVDVASQLGWNAMGLEIDPEAVRVARTSGLNIMEGTYEKLSEYEQEFDCIMCSHVLEHVHDPRDMVEKMKSAIKAGGVLMITLPNSLSSLRRYFGDDWRGLEAPRHLCIPSESELIRLLEEQGFLIKSIADNCTETCTGSYQIRRRGRFMNRRDMYKARKLTLKPLDTPAGNDLIKIIAFVPEKRGT